MQKALFWSVVVLSPMFCLAAGPQEEKWLDIFDGKSLKGWQVLSGFARFEVEDGMIVGTAQEFSPNSFLCTQKSYGDFILEFEVKDDPELNSGVQFRSQVYPAETTVFMEQRGKRVKRVFPAGRVYGYQVEIGDVKNGYQFRAAFTMKPARASGSTTIPRTRKGARLSRGANGTSTAWSAVARRSRPSSTACLAPS